MKVKKGDVSERSIITGEELRSQLRVLIALTLIMYMIMALIVWWTWSQASNNTTSLCAIRRQAQSQVTQGQEYLKQHPYGAFGLSRAQIQQSINNSISTVTALQSLGNC